jgi:hypothetical protein
VNCSSCNASNEADAVFCQESGASFGRDYPSCGASCSPGAKFCRKRRTPLGGDTLAKTSKREPRECTPEHFTDAAKRGLTDAHGLFAEIEAADHAGRIAAKTGEDAARKCLPPG